MHDPVWRPVSGFEGQYDVSNMGIVRSRPRDIDSCGSTSNYQGTELTPRMTDDGDLFVTLNSNGHKRRSLIRILVLEAFIGPRPIKHIAHHKNRDRLDCRLDNLEWAPNTMRRRPTHRVSHI